jgi:hypothetical protein
VRSSYEHGNQVSGFINVGNSFTREANVNSEVQFTIKLRKLSKIELENDCLLR